MELNESRLNESQLTESQLTESERAAFHRDGYSHLPAGSPASASRTRSLRSTRTWAVVSTRTHRRVLRTLILSRAARHGADPRAVLGLGGAALVDALLAPGRVREPSRAQIALRFPLTAQPRTSAPSAQLHAPGCGLSPGDPLRPHLDASCSLANGVRQGQVAHFTLLCMLARSDLPADFAGYFTGWPGSHRLYERYFQTHDVRDTPRLEHLPEPTQPRVRAGDVVLDILADLWLADLWREFPGLQRLPRG